VVAVNEPSDDTDPVLVRRRRIGRLVDIGQKVGYAAFGVAILAFAWGLATGWSSTATVLVIGALVVGSVVLAPSIVFGYAVKAADREDQEPTGWR
jgi:hypothetical protein